jgi:peptide/nickel transport system substrate-binding protein
MTGRKARFHGGWARRALLLLLTLTLVASACGGKKAGTANQDADRDAEQGVESGLEDADEPTRGGSVVYGLEAETEGGWCLSDSQLAISGIQVARTVYETLTVPGADGEYEPYLAESYDHNPAYDEWTFKLREGIKFHDGTTLNAEVVKNNFDAFRGKDPDRTSTLLTFVFQNLEQVEVIDDLTVKFHTSKPWVAFPGFVYNSGRTGIMAQAQLDDIEDCNKNLIGTGPFEIKEWTRNQRFVATAFDGYWREAPDGKPYPYLDEIEYRPIVEGSQRLNALQSGEIQAMHTSSATHIQSLRDDAEAGDVNLLESNKFGEVSYLMLNSDPEYPAGNRDVRKAIQLGVDRAELNEAISNNLPVPAEGPFAPGNLGHLEDAGWPEFSVDEASALVEKYKADGGDTSVTLTHTPDPEVIKTAELIQRMLKDIGFQVDLKTVDQATLISIAISGEFDMMLFRNHPGGDPDTQYNWWQSESIINFGNINDPEIDRLLDAGRGETDPDTRKQIYEDLSRQFVEEAWNIWFWYTPWAVGLATDVHGVYGPELPDGAEPYPGLATGHSVLGLWKEGG